MLQILLVLTMEHCEFQFSRGLKLIDKIGRNNGPHEATVGVNWR